MRTKAIIRLLFMAGVFTWLGLVFSDLLILVSHSNGIRSDIPSWLPTVILNFFILSLYYYYKLRIEKDDLNFVDQLWRVFATGLVATVISLTLRLIEYLLGSTKLTTHVVFLDFIYLINLALTLSFLIMAFSAWKRLILYQKSKWLLRLWGVFEYGLLITLLYNSFNFPFLEWLYRPLLIFFIVIGVVLSANMKWVAFLNFRQKWTSLLLLLLTIFYLGYGLFTNSNLAYSISKISTHFTDYRLQIFILSLITFVTIYSIFSFLVILFNLPTTSVFEQKLEEVVNFQRISQSIQTEQSEESVYNILLETSVSTVFADAAWLEIKVTHKQENSLFTFRITEKESQDIIQHLNTKNVKGIIDQSSDKTKNLSRHLASLKGSRFRSILAFPIYVKGENIGTLALLKELPEGFNKEMTKIVSTFANQAGISIENFRLLEEALQNERYKEELKIAKTVQKSLLPEILEKDPDFDIAAFSESADEVGGDYYDTARISDHLVSLIIADVSGKGTTAAFHMSQMKGIFHSLAQQDFEPHEFMARANQALVYCLERGSFISASYFIINTMEKKVHYARAGHCPVLYYHAENNCVEYFKDKGIALGMVRNKTYANFIQSYEFAYKAGDIMVLYTDGITEAKGNKKEEFGYDRLATLLLEVKTLMPRQIQEHLIKNLYEFSGTTNINDDYTTMIIKFK